jgi:hypothetical protein
MDEQMFKALQRVAEAAEFILPEVHALYNQAGHGILHKQETDKDIVTRKAARLKAALESLRSVETKPEALTAEDGAVEVMAEEFANRLTPSTIKIPRSVLDPGRYVGFLNGHRSRDWEVAGLREQIKGLKEFIQMNKVLDAKLLNENDQLSSKLERMELALNKARDRIIDARNCWHFRSFAECCEILDQARREIEDSQALKDEDGRE